LKKFLPIVASLLFLGSIVWGLITGVDWYISLLKSLDKQVAAAIIAASTTVLVSVLSIILAKYFENKRLIEKDIREKKIAVYEKLITYFFKLTAAKDKTTIPSIEEFFIDFAPGFITWGSDEAIKLWSDFRKTASQSETQSTLLTLEKLLLIIRKDIGHQNTGLANDHVILRAFINDIDKLYSKK
jgi:hypothetical protein